MQTFLVAGPCAGTGLVPGSHDYHRDWAINGTMKLCTMKNKLNKLKPVMSSTCPCDIKLKKKNPLANGLCFLALTLRFLEQGCF